MSMSNNYMHVFTIQGPVVQSIVSLTSSLRGQLVFFITKYTNIFVESMNVYFQMAYQSQLIEQSHVRWWWRHLSLFTFTEGAVL